MSRYGGQAVFGAELQVRSAPFRETGEATEGFALSRQRKEGASGTAYFDGAWTYSTGTLTVGDDGVARPVVASRTEYTEAIYSGSSGANTTSYSTTFYSRELAVEKVTTTHPTVSTSINGSGTAATESVYLDRAGPPLLQGGVEERMVRMPRWVHADANHPMLGAMTNARPIVAHFTSAETGVMKIATSRRLLLNELSRMSDPGEPLAPYTANLLEYLVQRTHGMRGLDDLDAALRTLCSGNLFGACFSGEQPNLFPRTVDRAFGRPALWHAYGDRSRGVAFVFQKDALYQRFSDECRRELGMRCWGGEVSYHPWHGHEVDEWIGSISSSWTANPEAQEGIRNYLAGGSPDRLAGLILDHARSVLFWRKLDIWSHESEYRLLAHVHGITELPTFDFGESLIGIVLGHRSDEGVAVALRALVAEGTDIFRLMPSGQPDFALLQIMQT